MSGEMPEGGAFASHLDAMVEDVEPGQEATTAFLVGLSGRHAGKLFQVPAGESLIGRSSGALVSLDEKAVSHRHAKLILGPTGCFAVDLGSTNGTFVNDISINEPTILRAGDVVRCGTTLLGYLTDANDDVQHTRALARVTGSDATPGMTRASVPSGMIRASMPSLPPADTPNAVALSAGASMAPGAGEAPTLTPFEQLERMANLLGAIKAFLKSYWKLMLLMGMVCAALGGATVVLFPPKATAEVQFLLRGEKTNTPRDLFASREVDFFSAAEQNFSNLKLVQKTMRDVDLPGDNEGAVRAFASQISLLEDTPGMYIGSYTDTNAEFAEKLLGIHVQNYLDHEIAKALRVMQSEVELLKKEYAENDKALHELEESARVFKEEHLEELPENVGSQVTARIDLRSRKDQLSADLTRFTQELALARRQLASEDALVESRVASSRPYEAGLSDVRRKIAAATAKGYASGHPELVQLRKQEQELLRLRDGVVSAKATDTERRANPEHKRLQNLVGQLQVSVSATGNELGLINKRLSEMQRNAGSAPAVEAEFSDLSRKLRSSRELHAQLNKQLQAKELQLEIERASVAARYEMIKEPHAWPVDMTKIGRLRGLLGFFFGLFVGIFIAGIHWVLGYYREGKLDAEAKNAPPSIKTLARVTTESDGSSS